MATQVQGMPVIEVKCGQQAMVSFPFLKLPPELFERCFLLLSHEAQKNFRLTSKDYFQQTRVLFIRNVKWLCRHTSDVCLTQAWKIHMRCIRLSFCQDVSCIPYYIQELELIARNWENSDVRSFEKFIKLSSHLVDLHKLVVKDQSNDTDDCLDVDLSDLPELKYAEIEVAGIVTLPKSATLETLILRKSGEQVNLSGQTALKRLVAVSRCFRGLLDLKDCDALEEVKLRVTEPVSVLFPAHFRDKEEFLDEEGFRVLRPQKPLLG